MSTDRLTGPDESSLSTRARYVSTAITILYYTSIIIALVAATILVGIIFISVRLSPDTKLVFACILPVCLIALQVALFCARKEEIVLLLFSFLSSNLSTLVLGIAIGLAIANVV